ncbi:fumarate hydratase class I subunit A [Firmicutes bacterium CAG:552]|nr:fumarate hydratase class I subunit A [Firmicutes bacterium CAG:552]
MREIDTEVIVKSVKDMVGEACFTLADGVMDALKAAEKGEAVSASSFALGAIIENARIASENHIPVCQDTGMAVIFAKIGVDVHFNGDFNKAVNEGVRQGYKENNCRSSVLDPLTRKNTSDNTPAIIHVTLCPGDKVELTFLPKGFGSENMSKLYMLTPAAGKEGVMDKIVEAVTSAGANPCPPIIVGVGIGGTADYAMQIAKEALLRECGTPSQRQDVAEMEQAVLKRINESGIGVQGFGGVNTALEVRIETYPTHIAALPVGVAIQCNAHRKARRII